MSWLIFLPNAMRFIQAWLFLCKVQGLFKDLDMALQHFPRAASFLFVWTFYVPDNNFLVMSGWVVESVLSSKYSVCSWTLHETF